MEPMFDDLKREFEKLERGVQVPVQLEPDDAGYLDRCCPSDDCSTSFKVHFDDWRDKVRDDQMFCPICRYEDVRTEWNTVNQDEYLENVALAYVQDRLSEALSQDTRRFNRRQNQNSLITMSMSYRPGIRPVVVPASATDVMTQQSTCEQCLCRYSSVGAAFFCPACGHNSAVSTFDNAIETVRRTIETLPSIRTVIEESAGRDVAEDSARHICENGLVKIVSSFQRFAEACFDALPNSSNFPRRRNLFQNLEESHQIWKDAIGRGYQDMLTPGQYDELNVYFQQRHLLAHQEGIVDQQYIDRAGDTRFAVGQRLVVTESSVLHLAELVTLLADEIR